MLTQDRRVRGPSQANQMKMINPSFKNHSQRRDTYWYPPRNMSNGPAGRRLVAPMLALKFGCSRSVFPGGPPTRTYGARSVDVSFVLGACALF